MVLFRKELAGWNSALDGKLIKQIQWSDAKKIKKAGEMSLSNHGLMAFPI